MADQVEAMKEIERHMAGIVEAPIGDRRRDVAIHLALKHRIPLFVIVSTIAELYQWRKALLQPDHGIPEASVGLIGDSRFEPGRAVTIALHLTLWRRWTEVSTTTGVICVDRADSAGLTTIFKTRFWHSKYLVGLATGVRQDGLTGLLKAYLGRYVARLDAPLRGRPDLRVRFTDLAWDSDDWLDLMDRIASDETRNRLIATDILQEAANRGKVLVLAERVNHLEQISRLIGQMGGGDMDVITSLVKEPERNQWFAEFADGRRKVLGVCLKSLPLINELACIRALIMASPIGAMDHLVMVAGKVASIGVIHEYKDRPKVLKFSLRRRLKVYRGMGII
jgi:superfamily II DNA or RNA helicase